VLSFEELQASDTPARSGGPESFVDEALSAGGKSRDLEAESAAEDEYTQDSFAVAAASSPEAATTSALEPRHASLGDDEEEEGDLGGVGAAG